MIDAAWRLVSYGNAFLLGRYDGDALMKAALSRGIARWRFDTLQARPHALAPLRTVAHDPYGWFRWLRKMDYRRLVLRSLTAAEFSLLDGPLKAVETHEQGYMIAAEHAHGLTMLWYTWRVDYTEQTWFTKRAAKVQVRGSDVFALPEHVNAGVDALIVRCEALFAEASVLVPEDAAFYERARVALTARDPETAAPPDELPMLAPSTHTLAARRLMAAVLQAQHADARHDWHDPPPPRPGEYDATIRAAVLAAANTIA